MARRKLFSPRTKSQIKSRTGEKRVTFRKPTTGSSQQQNTETGETVCVQVRGTFCVGVSPKLRTELWQSILKRPGVHNEARNDYDLYLRKEVSPFVVTCIEKDVGRTFPEVEMFGTQNGEQSLKNVLLAYAAYDPVVGYCQGMNFLAGLLLLYLPVEADAFGALVLLMQERGLRDLYTEDMSLLEVCLFQLSQLLPESLTTHLESVGALPVLYASSWFLTCFAAAFPLQIAARIMDVVLWDSVDAFMLKVSYALIRKNRKNIMAMRSMEDILEFMTTTLPNWNVQDLQDVVTEALQTAWSKSQRSIVENTAKIESVYDTISRVEGALSASPSSTDEDTSRSKKSTVRRPFAPMALLLPHVLTSNIKLKAFQYMHIPVQSLMRRFR